MTEPLTDKELEIMLREGVWAVGLKRAAALRQSDAAGRTVPRLLATIDALLSQLREQRERAAEVEPLRRYLAREQERLTAAERTVRKQREALEQLEHWDMLTIAHDHRGWYGVSTGDAVWARRLIAKALGDPDPTAALAPDTEEPF